MSRSHEPGPGGGHAAFDVASVAARFAPVVWLHPDDPHRPASVPWYLERTRLRRWRGILRRDEDLLPVGQLTPARLMRAVRAEQRHRDGRPDLLYLDIPRSRLERETRRGFRPSGGKLDAPCYVHGRAAPDDRSVYDIQFWFFYAFNGREGRHVTHEGDWEHVTARVTNSGGPELVGVYLSAHGGLGGPWAAPEGAGRPAQTLGLTPDGHPVVYSALGSHASYAAAGAHRRAWYQSSDRTAEGGPRWDTANDLVVIDIDGERPAAPGPDLSWVEFPGLWGARRMFARPFAASGPPGPAFQPSWRRQQGPDWPTASRAR